MSTTRILILLGSIATALPLLLFMDAVMYNPDDNEGILSTIPGGHVLVFFAIGALFEIKRLSTNTNLHFRATRPSKISAHQSIPKAQRCMALADAPHGPG